MAQTALQFVAAVRRRWAFQRGVDAVLFAMNISAALTLIVVTWDSVTSATLTLLYATAITIGTLWAWLRRPSLLSSARLADAALDSSDLLSTMLKLSAGDAEFAQMLHGQADAFCRQHRAGAVPLPHRSGQTRLAMLLGSLIALNLAWLRQPQAARGTFALDQSESRGVLPAQLQTPTIEVASPTDAQRSRQSEADDASAAERTFGIAGGPHSPSMHRVDSKGSARAQTPDAAAQRLPPMAGGIAGDPGNGQVQSEALATDKGFVAAALPYSAIGSPPSAGRFTAAPPPAAYRDLIQAYFSVSPH